MIRFILVVFFFIFLSLFSNFEPHYETWGSWFFAKVFSQSGQFVILDRSPIYTLYLMLFNWLGYPHSLTVEYIVSSGISVFSLYLFSKKYVGSKWAVFISILWIPFLQVSPPPVQKLAFASSLFAFYFRQRKKNGDLSLSYAFLVLSYFLRGSYLLVLLLFLMYDFYVIIKSLKLNKKLPQIKFNWKFLYIIFLLGMLPIFSVYQSSHKWNNVWYSDTTWYPTNGKKLSDSVLVYGTVLSKFRQMNNVWQVNSNDAYSTYKTYFNQEKTMSDILRNHFKFLVVQRIQNIKSFIRIQYDMTFFQVMLNGRFGMVLSRLLVIIVFYSVFSLCVRLKDVDLIIFMLGNGLTLLGITFFGPSQRYMYPAIPFYILTPVFLIACIQKTVNGKFLCLNDESFRKSILIAGFFVFFSPGIQGWGNVFASIKAQYLSKTVRIFENPNNGFKSSYADLKDVIVGCHGILSFEHLFIATFMDVSIEDVYDIGEVPPFNSFENSHYKGLNKDRINCIYISNRIYNSIPYKYNHYILPYENYLISKGAKTLFLNNGRVTKL